MGNRVFLTTVLPPLSFDTPPEMPFEEVDFFLRLNLSSHELRAIAQLETLYDLKNIRSWLMGSPMTAQGAISRDLLRERLEEEDLPIPETAEFFSQYSTLEEQKKNAPKLLRMFLEKIPPHFHPFVRQYFCIENTCRALFAFLRAKNLGQEYDVHPDDIGFDPTNHDSWPDPYASLLPIWQAKKNLPLDLEEAIARWKFAVVQSLSEGCPPFSLEAILGYLVQLRIVERQQKLKDPLLRKNEL